MLQAKLLIMEISDWIKIPLKCQCLKFTCKKKFGQSNRERKSRYYWIASIVPDNFITDSSISLSLLNTDFHLTSSTARNQLRDMKKKNLQTIWFREHLKLPNMLYNNPLKTSNASKAWIMYGKWKSFASKIWFAWI